MLWRRLGAGIVAAGLVAACGGPGSGQSQSTSGGAPIKIGLLASLSGARPLVGKVEQASAQAAIDDVNKAGGVNGRKLELDVQDDGFQTSQALLGAQRLIQDGVVAITGMASSNFQAAVQPVTTRSNVVVMGSVATSTGLIDNQPLSFRTSPGNDIIGEQVAKMMVAYGAKRVAIIHDTSDYAQTLTTAIENSLKGTSVSVVSDQSFTSGATDMTAQVINISRANPDAVVPLPIVGADLALILKTMYNSGLKASIYGHNGLFDPDALKLGSQYYSQMPRVCGKSTLDLTKQATKDFYARIQTIVGADPGNETAFQTYDAVRVLAQALKDSKGEGGEKLAKSIEKISHFNSLGANDSYYSFSATKHSAPTGDFMATQCWNGSQFTYTKLPS